MQVVFHKTFVKEFSKLPKKIQQKFDERLELFAENKFSEVLNNHSVAKKFPGCRSVNVTGDYRAIFKDEEAIVTFITIGTHS